jgi:hypothetical protein
MGFSDVVYSCVQSKSRPVPLFEHCIVTKMPSLVGIMLRRLLRREAHERHSREVLPISARLALLDDMEHKDSLPIQRYSEITGTETC